MSGVVIRGVLAPKRSEPRRRNPGIRSKPDRHAPRRGDRSARQLALAHLVERLVAEGAVADYAQAARLLGLTPARLTQIVNLTLLGPRIQEAILTGETAASERQVRATLREVEWGEQVAALGRGIRDGISTIASSHD